MTQMPEIRYLDRTTAPHLTTLVLIAGVAALSLNVFLPSLPSMAEHFGVDYAVMQLSVSLYLAATAIVQVVIGPISDRIGRRPLLLFAAAIFSLASLGAMQAPNFAIFLTCRLVQAIIATGFVLSRAVVRDMVPQAEAASMIGYVTMGMSVVPMLGPVLGGALDQAFGWQSSFLVLSVSGVALMLLIYLDLGETTRRRATSLTDQMREYPALLASQRFWGYCLAAAFSSGAFFAYLGGAPYVGTNYYNMDSAELGLHFGAPALGYMFGNFLSGRYSVRIGINTMAMAGALICTIAMAVLMALEIADISGPSLFFVLIIPIGIGNGLLMPNATAGMLSVRPELAGSAAGLGGAVAIGMGSAISALAGVILRPETGPLPLILLMLASSALTVFSMVWVMRRSRKIRGA